jgi:hypothetical protein
MIVCGKHQCAYCGTGITPAQRWVREKVYGPAPTVQALQYYRYHAELFPGESSSCWEKHLLEADLSHSAARAA